MGILLAVSVRNVIFELKYVKYGKHLRDIIFTTSWQDCHYRHCHKYKGCTETYNGNVIGLHISPAYTPVGEKNDEDHTKPLDHFQ